MSLPVLCSLRKKLFHGLRSVMVSSSVVQGTRHLSAERSLEAELEIPPERIRNFSIVAHVDHGKSTLADRMLELTGVIDKSSANKQVLDHLPVERERGITVKAQTATMPYHWRGQQYMLNLIDTPGHVDFNYEVSRSLAACQGVLLLIDAQQGVQAQTVANFLLAFEAGLSIIPVLNKIDLGLANVPRVVEQIGNAFGFGEDEIWKISAKQGTGVDELFPTIIERIPRPMGDPGSPLKMLLYDSVYDQYRGVICIMAIADGKLTKGDMVTSSNTGISYEVAELGLLQMRQIPQNKLLCGQVGYVVMGIRSVHDAHIGDTFHHTHTPVTPLPGFKPAKPMVFAGVYPIDSGDYVLLRTALEKLTLNDSSVTVYPDSSVALGQGWRLGFLGLLHMDVFRQRLEEEYDASVIVTSPSVPYKAIDSKGAEQLILNPAQFPEKTSHMDLLEPIVRGTLVFPDQFLGKLLKLCEDRRGVQDELLYLDQKRVMLKYLLPLSEIVVDFYDQVKSISSGYASFDYEDCGYRSSPLVKLDILLNGTPVDALAIIVHKDKARQVGKKVCAVLKEKIRRQLIEIAIQAAIGSKIVARENIKALRKDVTAKCYGGDMSRKMKLLKRQKEGKKKMKLISNVELSKEAFLSVLQR